MKLYDFNVQPHSIAMSTDLYRLLLLKATIMEVQRHGNPVPIAIPHRTMKDAKLGEFRIPEVNLSSFNINAFSKISGGVDRSWIYVLHHAHEVPSFLS